MQETIDALRPILQQGILFAIGNLSAERAMIVYEGVGVAQGLDTATMWLVGEISTTLIQTLLEEGDPMVMIDAAEDARTRDQTSAILSALRSVIYVPLRDRDGKVAGLLYADHRRRAGAFDNEQLTEATTYVNDVLTPQLYKVYPEGSGGDLDFKSLTETHWL